MTTAVRTIPASDAYALRRAVLRGGDPDANVAWAEDDRPTAFHLGVIEGGEIVAVASLSEESLSGRPSARAWRLRGMAVANAHQGRGIGRALLAEAIRLVRTKRATVMWCHARDTAMDFYANAGFVVIGDGFTTDETGLPHHTMARDL